MGVCHGGGGRGGEVDWWWFEKYGYHLKSVIHTLYPRTSLLRPPKKPKDIQSPVPLYYHHENLRLTINPTSPPTEQYTKKAVLIASGIAFLILIIILGLGLGVGLKKPKGKGKSLGAGGKGFPGSGGSGTDYGYIFPLSPPFVI